MGFMDKAKKLAEQGQAKLDEVQKNLNKSGQQQPGAGGPVVEYDKHGRPIQPSPVAPDAAAPAAASTPGVPPTGTPEPAAAEAPVPDPGAPGVPATAASSPPPAPGPAPPAAPTAKEASTRPDDEPPKMSSGDPLAG
jgi:hypothetical protein